MRHFIFTEQIEHEVPINFIVNAETLEEAIKQFAEDFMDFDESKEDLEIQGINSNHYTKEEILLMGFRGFAEYFTVYEIEFRDLETPARRISHEITENFRQTLDQLI